MQKQKRKYNKGFFCKKKLEIIKLLAKKYFFFVNAFIVVNVVNSKTVRRLKSQTESQQVQKRRRYEQIEWDDIKNCLIG